MKPRSLVVEDDPAIVSTVAEILASLGHDYDAAGSTEAARRLIESTAYCYFLIDLEIPVHSGRGLARIENGANLIDELIRDDQGRRHRIIAMTAHGNDGPHQAVEIMRKGIADYVPKPFPTSGEKTLDKAILRMLALLESANCRTVEQQLDGSPRESIKFADTNRTMVFLPDRVDLCGENITSGRSGDLDRKALNALRNRLQNQAFQPCTSKRLAAELGKKPASIPGFVRDLSKRIAKRLGIVGIECGLHDVIAHTEHGYQLRNWLSVQDADESFNTKEQGQDSGRSSDDDTVRGTVDGTVPGTAGTVTARRGRLRTIVAKEKLRVPGLAERLCCSERTIKRDLEALEDEIEFEGSPNSGYYRLRQVKNAR